MLTTRTHHSRRPATSRAGRLVAHAALAIALVIGVVFAHGGACAAVEFAESAAHSAPLEGHAAEPAAHHAHCLHRNLPERHHHGTEQDCSAIGPGSAPPYVAVPSATSVSSTPATSEAPSCPAGSARLTAPYLEDLCVKRI
ncbi:hypothetical protein ABGB18_02050 [Nonomuraea sp. B12E4]|uniref:hypothetical protein n=1 Tax=Nonomuraea sp. B12E4 TaxID=3153564 RepID=UPI00325C38B9